MLTEPTRRDLLSHATRLALLLTSVGVLPVLAQSQTQASGYNAAAFEASIDRRADEDTGRRLPGGKQGGDDHRARTLPKTARSSQWAVATALPGVNRMLIPGGEEPGGDGG